MVGIEHFVALIRGQARYTLLLELNFRRFLGEAEALLSGVSFLAGAHRSLAAQAKDLCF